jgi:hypothetical protein
VLDTRSIHKTVMPVWPAASPAVATLSSDRRRQVFTREGISGEVFVVSPVVSWMRFSPVFSLSGHNTDAQNTALLLHLVVSRGVAGRSLDQESPGSSPGGATESPATISLWGFRLFFTLLARLELVTGFAWLKSSSDSTPPSLEPLKLQEKDGIFVFSY